jgi:hypothetical protein
MKLNFWQWLGLIFFVVALALIIWRETSSSKVSSPLPPVPEAVDTEPATTPTTTPAPTTAP